MKAYLKFLMKLMAIPIFIGMVFAARYFYYDSLCIYSAEPQQFEDYKFTAVEYKPNEAPKEHSLVNINTADLNMLCTLDGVGPKTAQKIIDYRTQNGNFEHISEIRAVKGIGNKKFVKWQDKICIGDTK